jgi:deoxycytidylate deaminase
MLTQLDIEALYSTLKEQCKKSEHPKWKHAVLILSPEKEIISVGRNTLLGFHAEVRALQIVTIKNHCHNLILISGRISKDGKRLCMAKPCTSCYWYAMDRGVVEIYYTNERGTIVKLPKPSGD